MTRCEILTGSMGWSYDDWRGVFYSPDTPSTRLLEELSQVFSAVEVDASFYGAPRESTIIGWRNQTPETFVFTFKSPRAITHEKRLVAASEEAIRFAELLSNNLPTNRLGGVLLQLPPDFTHAERRNLDRFLEDLLDTASPTHVPWVIEFRHESWRGSDALGELMARGVSIATTEKHDFGTPLRYVRLLGDEGAMPRFDSVVINREDELTSWARRLDEARSAPNTVNRIFFFVRNYYAGHAPASLAYVRERLGLENGVPPGLRQMSLFD